MENLKKLHKPVLLEKLRGTLAEKAKLQQKVEDLEKKLNESSTSNQDLSNQISQLKSKVGERTKEIDELHNSLNSWQDKMDEICSYWTEEHDVLVSDIKKAHKEIYSGRTGKNAEGEVIKILSYRAAAEKHHQESSKALKEVQKSHSKILGDEDSFEATIEKHNQDISSLKKQINDLLPQTGAASLGYAYFDAKRHYHPEKTLNKGNKRSTNEEKHENSKVRHAQLKLASYYTMFILPLILLIAGGWMLIGSEEVQSLIRGTVEFGTGKGESLITKEISSPIRNNYLWLIGLRVSLSLPLLLISWFGFSSIRLNRRLYEEYNHKQRVMQLFHSFKTEIDKTSNPHLKEELLATMLHTVRQKPSAVMHKYDNPNGFWGLVMGWRENKTKNTKEYKHPHVISSTPPLDRKNSLEEANTTPIS